MTTDRLAALLHKEFITHEMGKGKADDICGLCTERAARLAAAGVTVAPALDVERLRAAARAAAFALDFHNKTPTGRRRSCDPKCIACAAIDALRAALATGDEP